jgi:hypothetical protein
MLFVYLFVVLYYMLISEVDVCAVLAECYFDCPGHFVIFFEIFANDRFGGLSVIIICSVRPFIVVIK